MRILVSTPTFLPIVGGAQLGIHEIYDRLGRTHDVTILTPQPPQHLLDGYGADDYASDNYRVRQIAPRLERATPRVVRRAVHRTSLPYIVELTRMIRRERPEVINFHYIKPHGGALIAMNRFFGVPTALSLVGRTDVMRLISPPKRRYAAAVMHHADVTLPNSTYYLGSQQHDPKIHIIPYGVDTNEFSPARRAPHLRHELGLSDEHFILFSVQRLAPVKRVDLLVQAVAVAVARNPRVALVIGGQGAEEGRLRALVDELGVQGNVKFSGYIDSRSLPEYFASSDAFAFHSLVETFGIVFVQAMAAGLPIIAADTSCVPDVLTPENGFLLVPFDVAGFADAILKLAEDHDLATRIGEHNRARAVREFDWDLIAAQYERAFHDIVSQRR